MADEDYSTGYGKPPVEHRFRPGRSGNPKGRPKGARGFKADVADALAATVTIREDGRSRQITVVAAALKRLLALAQQTEAMTPVAEHRLSTADQTLLDAYLERQREDPAVE